MAGSRTLADGGPTLLGAAELERANGPWSTPEGLHKTNLLLRLGQSTPAQSWTIDALHYLADWTSTDQVPQALIESGQLGRYGALDPSDGGNTSRDAITGEWKRALPDGFMQASAYAEHYRLRLWSDFTFYELRQDQAPDPRLPSDQFEQAESRNLVGASFARGWNHTLLGHDSTTVLGVQARHDHIDLGLLDTQSRRPFATVTNDHVRETSAAAYLENDTTWTATLRSVVGLRVDTLHMNVEAYATPQNSGQASAHKWSPKGTVIFGPWDRTEFFVSAGEGFHSNDARGVVDRIDPTTGEPSTRVPALASAVGKEVGLRTEAWPGLQSSLALWRLDSDSEIVYDADSDIGSTSPNGASRRYGVEWNNHYTAGARWLFDADLAWTHARYARMNDNGDTGNRIPNAIPVVARLGATWHPASDWSAAIDARYFSGYPLSQDGTLKAPSALVANLRLQKELGDHVGLSLDVLNLFNRSYDDIAYQQDYKASPNGATVPSGVTVHPGEPREFRLTLRWRH